MNPKQLYGEKLKDPKWQKRRLEVLERDHWKCSACTCESKTLHVHHLKYVGENPWDTPMEFLETLCEDCHSDREEANRMFVDMIREASTAELNRFGVNVAGALRIADTAPPQAIARGHATFILWLFNRGIQRIWDESKKSEKPPLEHPEEDHSS